MRKRWRDSLVLLLFTLFLGCGTLCYAQEKTTEPSLFHSVPDGWRFEPIPFPLSFAPNIPLTGLEELLFMPGMFKTGEPDFFSYVFMWDIEGNTQINSQDLNHWFKLYFAGLSAAVMETKEDLTSVTTNLMVNNYSFSGLVDWIEPFSTKSEQTLHVLGKQVLCKNHRLQVMVWISPKPGTDAVWQKLQSVEPKYC